MHCLSRIAGRILTVCAQVWPAAVGPTCWLGRARPSRPALHASTLSTHYSCKWTPAVPLFQPERGPRAGARTAGNDRTGAGQDRQNGHGYRGQEQGRTDRTDRVAEDRTRLRTAQDNTDWTKKLTKTVIRGEDRQSKLDNQNQSAQYDRQGKQYTHDTMQK